MRCSWQISSIQSFKSCFINHSSTCLIVHVEGLVVDKGTNVDVENDDGSEECNAFDDVKLLVNGCEVADGVETSIFFSF